MVGDLVASERLTHFVELLNNANTIGRLQELGSTSHEHLHRGLCALKQLTRPSNATLQNT
jgi:hypothetical protein